MEENIEAQIYSISVSISTLASLSKSAFMASTNSLLQPYHISLQYLSNLVSFNLAKVGMNRKNLIAWVPIKFPCFWFDVIITNLNNMEKLLFNNSLISAGWPLEANGIHECKRWWFMWNPKAVLGFDDENIFNLRWLSFLGQHTCFGGSRFNMT